ncbi:MAG: GNAT family N-acetyltransferase [Ardenticatenaceae bacterium]|nr:GNAT family N-acetyltransferase [Ardenticatenaceae bacterium]MCB8988012.1 GNAT family N-acetyltransferase [Ardenticatenaceae bacterium]
MNSSITPPVLKTKRLILRHLTPEDAAFILDLLNQPSFIQFIGDRGVRTLADARDYITHGPMSSYQRHGFGLYLALLKDGYEPIGICGLIKRETLPDVDVGYALLPQFWGQGLATEAATAVFTYGRETLGIPRIVGVVNADNAGSIAVLQKLGLRFEKTVRLSDDGPEVLLFAPEA